MLQKPDFHTARLLALADNLAESQDYDQNRWETCICGHACRLFRLGASPKGDFYAVGRELGLDGQTTRMLFGESRPESPTREVASRVVRHLALTGEVDWTI
jgi:hypothetical protein